jgi:hypothetical protein
VARGTKTEIRPGVWRLRVFVGTDPTNGNPRQLIRRLRLLPIRLIADRGWPGFGLVYFCD